MDAALQSAIDRIRAARAARTPLRIVGGASKDFYGNPPAAGHEVLSTRALSGVVAYEPSELVVTVRAGTPLAELEALLAAQGQCLPFEPPHFGPHGTVGGMVAAGLSGPARAAVGAVRDYVLGATIVNGKGELLTFGGQVMKNVAGYDVSRLMAGSLGTLGLITEVSLKVLPVAPSEATLRLALPQDQALHKLAQWGGQPLQLNASCWLREDGVDTLYVRLRGAASAVEAACRQIGGEPVANAAADWAACRDQRLPWFAERGGRDLWRLSLPPTAPVLELPEPPFVEWFGAQRWVRAEPGQGDALRAAARAAGGHATLFVAADRLLTPGSGRFDPQTAVLARIQRDLKRAFDPDGILNPGRLSPDF